MGFDYRAREEGGLITIGSLRQLAAQRLPLAGTQQLKPWFSVESCGVECSFMCCLEPARDNRGKGNLAKRMPTICYR